MPTVREVFERAYGPVPEGATCHVGCSVDFEGAVIEPCYVSGDTMYRYMAGKWWQDHRYRVPGSDDTEGDTHALRGDISECDAEAFSPVFGCAAYDAALDALKKEQYWREVTEAEDAACGMFAGGMLVDLGVYKKEPSHPHPNVAAFIDMLKSWSDEDAEGLADPDELMNALGLLRATKAQLDPRTVIALADAMAVAEQQAEEPGSCHADDVRAYDARERYMEASREFWAALSADGTGESPVLSTHLDVMGEGK